MAQKHVLLASCNSKYNQEMADAITRKLPQIRCDAVDFWDTGTQLVPGSKHTSCSESYDICFSHSQYHFETREVNGGNIQMLNLQKCNAFVYARHNIVFCNYSARDSYCSQDELVWPAPLSQLIFQIELLLPDISMPETKEPVSADTSQNIDSEESVRSNDLDQNCDNPARVGLHLRISTDCGKWLQRQISKSLAEGNQIYYLPLMPVYQMLMVAEPDKCGSNLSDLLLTIHQNCPPDINQIGTYTQMHPSGYLQFRPPDRADDIVCCEPENLRQLIVLLRQKIESLPGGRCRAWIDCQGLPLSTVARLAVLCDCLAVHIPQAMDFASQTARRELGLLMAKLPTSCTITEIDGISQL